MPIPIIPVIPDFSVSFLHFSLIPPFKTHFGMMSNGKNEEWRRMNGRIWPLSLGVILYWQRFATTVWWLWHCGALLRWAEEVEDIRTRNNLWKLTQHWTAAAGNCSSMKGHLKLRECVAQKKVEDRNSPHSWARRVLKRSYWDSRHWETSKLQHRHTQGLQIIVTSIRL